MFHTACLSLNQSNLKLKTVRIHIILLLLTSYALTGYGQSYTIDGYVIVQDLFLPVENQIINIKDEEGGLITTALTDETGFYSTNIETTPLANQVILELFRTCGGEVFTYNQQMPLSSNHLSYIFHVCEDKPCKAKFNYDRESLYNLKFEFTDITSGYVNEWYWDFGDGSTSTEQNPVHEYLYQDEYIVTLTVYGESCNDKTERGVYAIFSPCLAKYSYEQVNIGQHIIVNFANESEGQIENNFWNFGDGTYSTVENPHHQYAPGEYNVILLVSSPGGNVSILQKTIVVNPLSDCFALFKYEQEFANNLPIQFTDLSEAKELVSWHWTFGDNKTDDTQNPLHFYDNPGEYEVNLIVHSTTTVSNYTQTIEVFQSNDCNADFEYYQPNPEIPNIYFTSLTTDENLEFYWVFGDGTTSDEKSPIHQYADFGTYEVSLYILGYGCSDGSSNLLVIDEPVYCNAIFYTEQEYPQSRTISFFNESYGTDFSSSWDFGDGSSSSQTNPTHTYEAHGEYEAKLTISTSNNCIDSAKETILIHQPLSISGIVYAGISPLSLGSVYLYKLFETNQTELYETFVLTDGDFEFLNLTPGKYFVQAIPEFDFPLPTIPNYFPAYSGGVLNWQNAELVELDLLPRTIDVNLGSYNDFFNGKGKLAGDIIFAAKNNDAPLIMYLGSDYEQIFQFKIPDQYRHFEFNDIPYGNYTLYPEKAGKSGEPFFVSLDDNNKEMTHIIFLETDASIVPDLSSTHELQPSKLFLYPNPANDHFKIHCANIQNYHQQINIKVYSSGIMKLLLSGNFNPDEIIYTSDIPNGLYIVAITYDTTTVYRKVLIRH